MWPTASTEVGTAHTAAPPRRSREIGARRRRLLPAGAAAIMAVAALGGALGLISGELGLGRTVIARLPFQSPSLAGIALLLWVAVPMAAAAALAAAGSRDTDIAVMSAGGLLLEWIAIEAAVITTFSWLQFVCIGWALVLIVMGIQLMNTRDRN